MVSRAEAVVQLLFQLAEEAKPYRKAMAAEANHASLKKRKLNSGEGLLSDRTNGVKGEDKEFVSFRFFSFHLLVGMLT